eukprot:16443586-Heterocapsa_arctica.AAC.1
MHDRSDSSWRTHMEHDVDESELEQFNKQALDNAEWGEDSNILSCGVEFISSISKSIATVWTCRLLMGMNSPKIKSVSYCCTATE